VPLRTDAYYRDLAQEALRKANVMEPPVTVEDVAVALGVPILCVDFPSWFSGAIVYEEGLPLILLNRAIDEVGRPRGVHQCDASADDVLRFLGIRRGCGKQQPG
jgi:hypothetical protein